MVDHIDPESGSGPGDESPDVTQGIPATESGQGEDGGGAPPGRSSMTSVILQGLIGGSLLFLVFVTPFSIRAVEEIVAFALVAYAVFEGIAVFRRGGSRRDYARLAVALAAGAVLGVWPSETLVVAGYALAVVFVAFGAQDLWSSIRRQHEEGSNSWIFIRSLILLTLAGISVTFPEQAVELIVIGGSMVALFRAGLALWFSLAHAKDDPTIDPADTLAIVVFWLKSREMNAAEAEDIEMRVFLNRGDFRERIWRFGVLLGLATTIATFGIAADSTAVVIGAMLLAPLMTPILGTAAGLINGRTRQALLSAGITATGITGTIALAWALTVAIPDLQAVVHNAQVTSRTAPSLGDLIIALAAGAAGAYGVSRAESTDALPGVAVAIALVPPLSVVGITLHAGEFSQAMGALLLFLTNLFSIILMAGLVFVIVGYSSWWNITLSRNRIRASFAAVALAVILVSIPLALTAQRIIDRANDLRAATNTVDDWLGADSPMRISEVEFEEDTITVRLVGPGRPPPTANLSKAMRDSLGRNVATVVWWIEEQGGVAGLIEDEAP